MVALRAQHNAVCLRKHANPVLFLFCSLPLAAYLYLTSQCYDFMSGEDVFCIHLCFLYLQVFS